MKVLFINHVEMGRPGQADMNFIPLHVSKQGVDVYILSIKGGDLTLFEGSSIKVIEKTKLTLLGIRSCLFNIKPDIVHVFSHFRCGLYPILGYKCKGYIFDIRSPQVKKGILKPLIRWKNKFETFFYDVVTSHSKISAEDVIGYSKGVSIIPPGVDFELVSRLSGATSANNGGSGLSLVYAGSLSSTRKLENLILAFKDLGNIDVTLDLYGSGDGKDELINLIRINKLEERIRVYDSLPRESLYSAFAKYKVGVSYVPFERFNGGPPLKAIEYMSAGLYILATETYGNRMVLENAEVTFCNESPEGVAEAVRKIAFISDIDNKCYSNIDVAKSFSWENVISKNLMPVYNNLMTRYNV